MTKDDEILLARAVKERSDLTRYMKEMYNHDEEEHTRANSIEYELLGIEYIKASILKEKIAGCIKSALKEIADLEQELEDLKNGRNVCEIWNRAIEKNREQK